MSLHLPSHQRHRATVDALQRVPVVADDGAPVAPGPPGRRLEHEADLVGKREGDVLAVIGSTDHLEISVNRGSAATVLNADVGTPVRVRAGRGEAFR